LCEREKNPEIEMLKNGVLAQKKGEKTEVFLKSKLQYQKGEMLEVI